MPRIVYHILRRTLWPIKGHSSEAKLEGAMKTLVFYIVNGIRFNSQDFIIRQLAASGIDLFGLKFYAPWVIRLIKLHCSVNYHPSSRNHLVFLPEVDLSVEAIYLEPAKEPLYLHNVDHQSFTQPIEGVHVPNAAIPAYPLAGNVRMPHRANTEAIASTIAQRPRKRSHVLNDRDLLVALHQKQDKHHDWLKRQMHSLLVDVNHIRNLATKNLFVAHEACRRSWKSLTLLCFGDDLCEDGFIESFKFDSRPPQNASWRRTPSIEDSEHSSLAATVVARVVDEEDDATSLTLAALHHDSMAGPSAPPNSNDDPAPSSTPTGNE